MNSDNPENVTEILEGINWRRKPYSGILQKIAQEQGITTTGLRRRIKAEDPDTIAVLLREVKQARRDEEERKERARKLARKIAEPKAA